MSTPPHPEDPQDRSEPLNHSASPPEEQGHGISRRGLLQTIGAGVGVAVGVTVSSQRSLEGFNEARATPQGALSRGHTPHHPSLHHLDLDEVIVHGETPLTVEAKRHTIGTSVITHERHLFIRNNLPLPSREIVHTPDAWEVQVKGVKYHRSVSVAELKTLGLYTVATVLQCSGNGRAFYTHGPSGSQWATGAAGCVIWSGVKLSDVVDALGGVSGSNAYLTSTGGDPIPEGIDPLSVIVERSIPIEKALADGVLAWEMNGEPISIEHGGPLRLIIPGYFGCNQIKYLKQIAFTAEQTQSKIQRSGYRMRPIGQKGAPSQPSMWAMPLKSWVTNETQLYGPTQVIRGVALGGERAVKRVEISINGGESWSLATFVGPDLGRFAWRLFQLKVRLPPGEYQVVSRAYNDRDEVQPETRHENERGYGHNGWRDHILKVTIQAERPQLSAPLTNVNAHSDTTSKSSERSEEKSQRMKSSTSRALSAEAKRGREVFLHQSAPACGVCHRLDDAGAQGRVGPNLDELKPSLDQVKRAVSKGLGAMPAQPQLSAQQLDNLARYIVEVTSGE